MKPNTDQPKANAQRPDAKEDLKSLPMPELQAKLGSSPDGLSQTEAQARLTQYGPNEIEEKKTNLFLKFLSYFWGPIPWMIEAAVILSAIARHWPRAERPVNFLSDGKSMSPLSGVSYGFHKQPDQDQLM